MARLKFSASPIGGVPADALRTRLMRVRIFASRGMRLTGIVSRRGSVASYGVGLQRGVPWQKVVWPVCPRSRRITLKRKSVPENRISLKRTTGIDDTEKEKHRPGAQKNKKSDGQINLPITTPLPASSMPNTREATPPASVSPLKVYRECADPTEGGSGAEPTRE